MIKTIQKVGQKISLAFALLLIISNVNIASAQSGDIDTDTSNTNTCFNLSYNLRRGSTDIATSGDVTKLQQALIQLNYLSQDPSGYFGGATYSAVQRLQSANNLISSGYVGSYTRAAIQRITCNGNYNSNPTPNPYPTPNSSINLTPAVLSSTIYDQDSSGNPLLGINFINSNSNTYIDNNLTVSIINTNIPSVSARTSCYMSSGALYNSYATSPCGYSNNSIFVSFNSGNLSDDTYYYFTVRINQNGSYVDKQYSFTYKKIISMNSCIYGNCNTTCTYKYQNGVYGCYYNTAPDVSTCQYTGYNNNCNTGGFNGAYYNGNTSNNSGYYTSDNTYILY